MQQDECDRKRKQLGSVFLIQAKKKKKKKKKKKRKEKKQSLCPFAAWALFQSSVLFFSLFFL